MRIRIDYMAQARQAAGAGSETLEVPEGCTLEDLLSRAAERHGPELRALLLDGRGALRPAILVAVNDEQVFTGQAPALKDGDAVSVLTPVGGG